MTPLEQLGPPKHLVVWLVRWTGCLFTHYSADKNDVYLYSMGLLIGL